LVSRSSKRIDLIVSEGIEALEGDKSDLGVAQAILKDLASDLTVRSERRDLFDWVTGTLSTTISSESPREVQVRSLARALDLLEIQILGPHRRATSKTL
jgi:hypothetical protein